MIVNVTEVAECYGGDVNATEVTVALVTVNGTWR